MKTKYLLKISGAGNRFLLVDQFWFENPVPVGWKKHSLSTTKTYQTFTRLSRISFSERKKTIQQIIKKVPTTDGLIVIKKKTKSFFSCNFYNKDGSKANMCGNAACCVSQYAKWMNYPLAKMQFAGHMISCIKQGGITLPKISKAISLYNHKFYRKKINFSFIDTGVPHGVIEEKHLSPCFANSPLLALLNKPTKNMLLPKKSTFFQSVLNQNALKKVARSLRFKNYQTYKKGMNITFFQVKKQNHLQAITYERGVEDFTLGCGTGALAAGLVYTHKYKASKEKPIFIAMPGGTLKIKLKPVSLFSPVKKGY